MALDRISRLVSMAAADSGVSEALRNQPAALQAPLGLTEEQVRVLTASSNAPQKVVAPKLFARANIANVTPVRASTQVDQATDDPLLPPEGPGQGDLTPAPVIIGAAPIPAPTKPAPSPVPTPAPSQPAQGPVSQPAPAPFKAPVPLGPMPWQRPPGPTPLGPVPSAPVLRQPVFSPSFPVSQAPVYQAPISQSPPNTGVAARPGPTSVPCESPVLPPSVPHTSDSCNCCCIQVTALVASASVTAETAITAIAAIAAQR
jgi:hypothetical protein